MSPFVIMFLHLYSKTKRLYKYIFYMFFEMISKSSAADLLYVIHYCFETSGMVCFNLTWLSNNTEINIAIFRSFSINTGTSN